MPIDTSENFKLSYMFKKQCHSSITFYMAIVLHIHTYMHACIQTYIHVKDILDIRDCICLPSPRSISWRPKFYSTYLKTQILFKSWNKHIIDLFNSFVEFERVDRSIKLFH